MEFVIITDIKAISEIIFPSKKPRHLSKGNSAFD
jgi:hypothetical protein